MKKTVEKLVVPILVLLFTIFALNLIAQDKEQHRNMQQNKERIEAQKVAFITNRLDLSSAEAERFWPVYNDFKDELKAKQKTWRNKHDFKPNDIYEMSDTDAEEFAKDQLNHEQEMLNLRKGLITNMKGVISAQKIVMLLEAEKEFRVELMRKISHGRSTGVGRSEDRR